MGARRRYAFFALLTLSICALALYVHRHRQGRTGFVDNIIISATGYLQSQSIYFVRGAQSFVEKYLLLVNTQSENEELKKELAYLRTKLAALQEVETENARLREGLRFSSQLEQQLLAAHVIAHDVSSDYFGIRVDRGSDDGVKPGMGVISPAGLVGRILRVTKNYADVLTLVDPTSNIDAVIQRTRARGIISGQAKRVLCSLKYVDRLEDVAVNDTVVSSGFGSIFPKGLLVGYVTDVVPNPSGVLQKITVKSAVDIYRLEEVFIVFPPAESEKVS
ncbi:MAG: rod shape-determining protein MreC [Bdellovibrionales bacterium]|nr:rod shape-determining protein MreC [Bdellovibrionales bacterium]